VLTGADIEDLTEEEMREIVKITDVYARVSPEHKMKIVDALRDNGEVVAMTGDGVNDALPSSVLILELPWASLVLMLPKNCRYGPDR
jgi:high-affinity K+ transport system ATPase subunit B